MDLATIETRITEAEEALHKLMLGSREEQVQHADGMVRYTPAQAPELERYIAGLYRQKEALLSGGSARSGRRPIYPSQ